MSHEELWLIIRLANQLILVIHDHANVSGKKDFRVNCIINVCFMKLGNFIW